ncbi:hypothetical protein TNCV_272401 [Trichonephila clavipes]|nr:hypothetical protein TNCV_272401 [Trichonephila clavipes]
MLRVRSWPKSMDFPDAQKSTAVMSYNYSACKRILKGKAVGEIKFQYRFVSSELRCLPMGGNWAPKLPAVMGIRLTWCRTQKRDQLSVNVDG